MTENAQPGSDSVSCPDGGEHEWKFNGGNPMCWKCGTHRDGFVQRTFPATLNEDGTLTVHTDENGRGDDGK